MCPNDWKVGLTHFSQLNQHNIKEGGNRERKLSKQTIKQAKNEGGGIVKLLMQSLSLLFVTMTTTLWQADFIGLNNPWADICLL